MLAFLRLMVSSIGRYLSNCKGTSISEINDTTTSDLDYAIPEHWDTKIRIDAMREAFWGKKFEGPQGSRMPIISNTDFTTKAGDYIHFQVLKRLKKSGVTGESTLQSKEERLALNQFSLQVDWLRHAVGFNKRGTKRANFNAVSEAGSLLTDWLALKVDDGLFEALVSDVTPDIIYSGNKSAEDSLDSTCAFNTDSLDRIKLGLKRKGALPFKVTNGNGQTLKLFGVVIDPIDAYNLRGDEAWYTANRDALPRSMDNPIFSGAMGMWNGMIIYEIDVIKGEQGTWLRPEATLSADIAGTGGATVTVTVDSDTEIVSTKFFATTGKIQIDDEVMTYTAKGDYYFTVAAGGRGALGTASAAHLSGAIVTQRNISKQIGFGAELAVRGWGQYPRPTKQVTDYEFSYGVGIEAVFGEAVVINYAGEYPNYLLTKSYAENPNSSL